jgi:hypothetical protein
MEQTREGFVARAAAVRGAKQSRMSWQVAVRVLGGLSFGGVAARQSLRAPMAHQESKGLSLRLLPTRHQIRLTRPENPNPAVPQRIQEV